MQINLLNVSRVSDLTSINDTARNSRLVGRVLLGESEGPLQ